VKTVQDQLAAVLAGVGPVAPLAVVPADVTEVRPGDRVHCLVLAG
jgi:hypothetical protein